MKKITPSDIKSNEEYSKARDETRRRIIALRKLRRIEVGTRLSFTFENRDTVCYQIQEMMRTERISEKTKIQNEIDVYNDLIPDPEMLSATMFIEITETDQIKPLLDTFQGLDRSDTVYLQVDGEKIFAEFEPGHSKEDRISAVHYVKFRFNKNQAKRFMESHVELQVEHPSYPAKTVFTQEQKQEIAKDLRE